jgi:hypothetical protein
MNKQMHIYKYIQSHIIYYIRVYILYVFNFRELKNVTY